MALASKQQPIAFCCTVKCFPPQLFLELAAVKRVGLASAMCSPKDRLALKDVSEHVRRHLVGAASGGGPGGSSEERGTGGVRQLLELEAAVSTLGLQP